MTKNITSGRSIAIWADPITNSPTPTDSVVHSKLEVHFNYWHVKSQKPSKGKVADFFDIGIMAHSCVNIARISVYLPGNFDSESFEDLAPLFSNAVTASGIFNESLSVTTTQNSNHVTLNNGIAPFARVYIFDKDVGKIKKSELRIYSEGSGTIVEISQSAIANGRNGITSNTPLYFRLRVLMRKANGGPFSRTIRPVDSWLLSSFDYTEFLDFRLNEARNLPVAINQKMRHVGSIPIVRVDYLVVVGEAADVAGGVDATKKRLLENELWQEYTKSANQAPLSDGMIIHHWKKISTDGVQGIGDFSAFIKLKIRRTGGSLVWRYLVVVALIGCFGSLLASVVWTRFELDRKIKPSAPSSVSSSSINSAVPEKK